MAAETLPFDAAEFLTDAEARAEYLTAAFESGDPRFIAESIGVVARAAGMSRLAQETGMGRESLYKAFSAEGNPTLATLTLALGALGLRLRVEAREPADPPG